MKSKGMSERRKAFERKLFDTEQDSQSGLLHCICDCPVPGQGFEGWQAERGSRKPSSRHAVRPVAKSMVRAE